MKAPLSRILAVVCSVSIFCVSAQVYAHSGGTDEYGCHSGSMSYHCHDESYEFEARHVVIPVTIIAVTALFLWFTWDPDDPWYIPHPSAYLDEGEPTPSPQSDISSGVFLRF